MKPAKLRRNRWNTMKRAYAWGSIFHKKETLIVMWEFDVFGFGLNNEMHKLSSLYWFC